MTTSLPPRKSVKWGRLIPGGVLSVLVIAMALLWFAYQKDPASVARFYYIASMESISGMGAGRYTARFTGFLLALGFCGIASRTQSPTSV